MKINGFMLRTHVHKLHFEDGHNVTRHVQDTVRLIFSQIPIKQAFPENATITACIPSHSSTRHRTLTSTRHQENSHIRATCSLSLFLSKMIAKEPHH